MIEDKYIITEDQLCKLTHGIDDTLECRELILKIRADKLSEREKQTKNAVLDRVAKEIFKLISGDTTQLHYNPEDCYIPSVGVDELTDVIDTVRAGMIR
jgi:hypothetical protein